MARYLFHITVVLLLINSCKGKDGEPVEEQPLKTTEEVFCENTCTFANDSICDDGGPGSLSNYCGFATDCEDCGERTIITIEK
ncbi:hypothetical protein N8911_01505 [bacterium]|jgi:hypothetical protein|nr:hypothetical protein [bacterium]